MSTTKNHLCHNLAIELGATTEIPNTSAMKRLGSFLRELRKAHGLTQKEVALRLDLEQETISRFENMDVPPKIGSTYRKLVELYGFTVPDAERQWKMGETLSIGPIDADMRLSNSPPAADSPAGEKLMAIVSLFRQLPPDMQAAAIAWLNGLHAAQFEVSPATAPTPTAPTPAALEAAMTTPIDLAAARERDEQRNTGQPRGHQGHDPKGPKQSPAHRQTRKD
jgi:transcriptional regulator with XRE-family HTH domain